jgi:hypothetical protein
MRRFLITLALILLPLQVAAQALDTKKPDEPAIPILTYVTPDGHVSLMNTGIPGVNEVLRWLRIKILTAALDDAKAVSCPSIGDGSVTVSYGLNVGGELVVQIGINSGLSFTFECENNEVKKGVAK